jgi:hypothetical protein
MGAASSYPRENPRSGLTAFELLSSPAASMIANSDTASPSATEFPTTPATAASRPSRVAWSASGPSEELAAASPSMRPVTDPPAAARRVFAIAWTSDIMCAESGASPGVTGAGVGASAGEG